MRCLLFKIQVSLNCMHMVNPALINAWAMFAARGPATFLCFFVWSSGVEFFRVHGYSFLNWTSRWNKTKQYIGGLPPAFVGVFGHFYNYSFILSLHQATLSQNFQHFWNQGPVVRTPVGANPGLNFNPGFFFFLSKALYRIILSIFF